MNKNSNTYKQKWLQLQAIKKSHHELKRRNKRKLIKKLKFPNKLKKQRAIRFTENPNSVAHDTYKAPENLSLIDDPDNVINFFAQAKSSFAKDIFVQFDLTNVKKMGPETLTFYCALLNSKEFIKNSYFIGNYPEDENIRKMFQVAGFSKHVSNNISIDASSQDISGELIHRITRTKVESELAGAVCISAIDHSYGTNDIRQKFYPVLIECMDNTVDHSNYGKKDKIYNWWLLAYKEPNSTITKFCFLDLGVGIFGSINKKFKENNLGKRLIRAVVPEDNVQTLNRIFEGEQTTSTGKKERGLGLKNIYDTITSDETIHNFTILSNDVIAKIGYNKAQEIKRLNQNFEGTLFYWEIYP